MKLRLRQALSACDLGPALLYSGSGGIPLTIPDNSGHQLNAAQLAAVDLVVAGNRDHEVGAAVRVSRQTVCGWRMHDPYFRAAVNARRLEVWGSAVERIRALLPRAAARLEMELDGPNGWRVALRLVELSGLAAGRDRKYGMGVGPANAGALIDEEVAAGRPQAYINITDLNGTPPTSAERSEALLRLQERAAAQE
jgi:hypothetical protein